MKLLLLLSCLLSFTLLGQENPWEPKKTENPWEEETEEKETPLADSTATVEKRLETPSSAPSETLLEELKADAKSQYKAGGDFAVGFVSGFILNYGGTFVSGIYSLPNNKKEKRIIEAVAIDSAYTSIDKETLKKQTKNAVKSKKVVHALLGSIAGAFAQIGVIVAIALL